MNKFLQLHFLTSYPAALLNRDDAGFAKRIPFGGIVRTRVSSQCLKRHWRTFEGEYSLASLEIPMSIRSRLTFDYYIRRPLVEEGVSDDLAVAVTEALAIEVLGQSAKAERAKAREAEESGSDDIASLQTGQITVLGHPEVEYLLGITRLVVQENTDPKKVRKVLKDQLGKDGRKNLLALGKAAIGLDGAMFGRMVTSDILARGDAAVHVAHALTVHAEETESDYFSAVDDLKQIEEHQLGSGHIGNVELTSGLYYGYLVIDVPLLVSNLEGCEHTHWQQADRELAARVCERMVQLVARVSPGAKLGSTAPYAYAHFLMVESGSSQPRTLANAFLKPVREYPDLLGNTYHALSDYVEELDKVYGLSTDRGYVVVGEQDEFTSKLGADHHVSLDDLASWTAEQVKT